jgi:hypothetical protein
MIGGKQMDGQILWERKGNEPLGSGEGEEIVKAKPLSKNNLIGEILETA